MTERTYFRHFPDKREVLFHGERQLTEWVTEALAPVPADVPLWPAMRRTVNLIVPPSVVVMVVMPASIITI